jgi:hypothetical protein
MKNMKSNPMRKKGPDRLWVSFEYVARVENSSWPIRGIRRLRPYSMIKPVRVNKIKTSAVHQCITRSKVDQRKRVIPVRD